MRDESGPDTDAMQEAFDLLADETRLGIIRELCQTDRDEPPTYVELMDAVGMEDSGRFNYHLQKLRGHYVRKRDGRYVPLAAATAVYRAVLATRPTSEHDREEVTGAGTCRACGEELVGTFHNGFFNLRCDACEEVHFAYHFPKGGLHGRSDAEVLAAVDRIVRAHTAMAVDGVCPFCGGHVAREWVLETDTGADAGALSPPHMELTCGTCSYHVGIDVPMRLLADPDTRQLLAHVESEFVTGEWYVWELDRQTANGDPGRVRSTDPVRVAVDLAVEDRTLTVVLGESGGVSGIEFG